MRTVLDRIKEDLEIEGYEPDSKMYDYLLLERRVEYCMVLQGVASCPSCKYFDECNLVKDYMYMCNGMERPKTNDEVVEETDEPKTKT